MTSPAHDRPPQKAPGGLLRTLARFIRGERGNVATLFGLLLVPIIGSLALATEASNWFLSYRAMQNAADSAVLAAANNGNTTMSGNYAYYQWAALSVASNYGFAPYGLTNGSHDTTVTVQNGVTCPNKTTACYQVTITHNSPIYLTTLVGFKGTTTSYSGAQATLISVSAIAGPSTVKAPDCIVSLATSGTAITVNGGSNVDLSGCTVMSNSTGTPAVNCNGHDLNADATIAVGTVDSKCSNGAGGATAVSDPYATKSAKIPSDKCGGSDGSKYPQEGSGTVNQPNSLATFGTAISGKSGYYYFCGDVQLTGNISVTDKRVLVIYNGQLDINGYTLSTSSTGGLTVVLAGQNTVGSGGTKVTPFHRFADNSSGGKGVINIAAPTTDPTADGVWGGVAIYQSPYEVSGSGVLATQMTDQNAGSGNNKGKSLDITAAGSSPTLDITGLTYLPNAAVTLSGAINKSSYGAYCFVLVVNNMTASGSGSIFKNSQSGCTSAGTTQVYSNTNRYVLLQ